MNRNRYDLWKRIIDLVIGSVALVLSLPLQVAIAALVRTRLGSPVLFRQRRPGKDDQIFELVKFRTMLEPDPARGLVSDAERATAFIRRRGINANDQETMPEFLGSFSEHEQKGHLG